MGVVLRSKLRNRSAVSDDGSGLAVLRTRFNNSRVYCTSRSYGSDRFRDQRMAPRQPKEG